MIDLAAALVVADARAQATEAAGRLDPSVFDALVDCAALRQWATPAVGGAGATVTSVLDVIEQFSRADGATGWCVMIANTTALTSYRLREPWASTIFADPAACTGGYGMPVGTAVPVDGGLEVTGRWAWGSGTDHCTWIGGGVRVVDADGQPTRASDGASTPFVFFAPDEVELLDTWYVAGMKGTASTDYQVTKALVPDGRWVQLVGTEPVAPGPLGQFPFFGALAAGVAACLVGLAQRAVDELLALATKTSMGSSRTLAERSTVQADLARSMADIAQSRAYLHSVSDRLWERAEAGHDITGENRAELRLAATMAAQRCVEAVDRCYHAAGGAAVYETNALQRVFRDAHVGITHGMIAPRTLEALGRHAFGLPTDTRQF